MHQTLRMLILAILVLVPMWLLANNPSADEARDTAFGLLAGAVGMGAWKAIETLSKEHRK